MNISFFGVPVSHPLLTAPIGRSLLLLAGPTTALMLVQILVAIADGVFVGRLGTEALAGLALVIPFSLNFASQGAGRMKAPLLASFARLITATVAGWIVIEKTTFGLDGLFEATALGIVVSGCLIAGSLLAAPWREKGKLAKSIVK